MNKQIEHDIELLSAKYGDMDDDTLVYKVSEHGRGEMVYYLLYGRYRTYLESIFHRLSNINECFPDLLADLLLHLIDNRCSAIRSFESKSSFKTWLSSVARNFFINKLHQVESIYNENECSTNNNEPFALTGDTDIETLSTFRQVLSTLPSIEQRIVLMKEVEGYNAAEIAHILTGFRKHAELQPLQRSETVTVGNVYKIRQRAVDYLASIFQKEKNRNQKDNDNLRFREDDLLFRIDEKERGCHEPMSEYNSTLSIIYNIFEIKADIEFAAHRL